MGDGRVGVGMEDISRRPFLNCQQSLSFRHQYAACLRSLNEKMIMYTSQDRTYRNHFCWLTGLERPPLPPPPPKKKKKKKKERVVNDFFLSTMEGYAGVNCQSYQHYPLLSPSVQQLAVWTKVSLGLGLFKFLSEQVSLL